METEREREKLANGLLMDGGLEELDWWLAGWMEVLMVDG